MIDFSVDEKVVAFVGWYREQGNKIAWEDCDTASYDSNSVVVGNPSSYGPVYLVVNDDVADQLWEDYLDNYLDECVLPDLPESAQMYFDRESWKNDARHDGRGHSLASYDGCENEYQDNDGEYWYIYRVG